MNLTNENIENSILGRLKELESETDFEFVVELINIFINETPKQIQNISNALKEKNHSALRISAHTLKGSSLNLGAKKLGELCLKFEELGKSNKEINDNMTTKEIEEEFAKVTSILNSFIKKSQGN